MSQLIAMLPLLLTGTTAIVAMLSIAIKRNHTLCGTVTVAGLNLALLSVVYAFLKLQGEAVNVTPLLIVDGYAYFYMGLLLISTLACATLAHAYFENFADQPEEFYLLLTIGVFGGIVLCCSHHLASLFIGVELLSVPVYGMAAYAFREQRSLESGIKYLVLSAVASAFLLFGMALLYASSGTLLFAGLGASIPGVESNTPLILVGVSMILVALAFKLSVAPFHLWTPDVYQGAPAPVATFLASASKVAVFAVMVRLVVDMPAAHHWAIREAFTVAAVASILIGNLLALLQTHLKRVLAYSSIAHMGYLLIAVVAANENSIDAIGMYLLTYVVTTLGAFGVVTLASSPHRGPDADALFHYRGLFWRRPYLTAIMTTMMLSLAGIPFTAGFIGKFYLFFAGVESSLWLLMGALILGSALGLYYYLRVLVTLYLTEPGMRRFNAPLDWGQQTGGIMVLLMAILVLLIGFYPEPFIDLVRGASMAGRG